MPVDAYKKMTRNQVDEQLFGPDGKMYNTLHCPKNKQLGETNEYDDNNGVIRPDELLYDDQEDSFFAKIRKGSKDIMADADPETTTVATSAVYG